MPSLYSDIINNDALWTQPNLDHAAALAVVGIASTTNADDTRLALTNLSVRTPTVLAFTLDNEPESIYCGYNPTLYPADLGNATPFDLPVGLICFPVSPMKPSINLISGLRRAMGFCPLLPRYR